MTQPGFGELVRVFGRIGCLSFGGPAAQIALMHRELVDRRDWLDEDSYLRALSLCMLLPGPEAMQLATYAGWRLRGVRGGLIAGGLFVLPGALVISVLAWFYVTFGTAPLVQAAFMGVKAAVVVIVLQALRKLAGKALTGRRSVVIAGLAFAGIFALDLPFPLIVAAAALWGYLATAPATEPPTRPAGPAGAPVKTAAIWTVLWLAPLSALSFAGHKLLADIGWFFAWLAVVTFGGAYAVLAYMAQTVVDRYGWVSSGQMIDALGLAETTPGPLILVTQFVAMLTGFAGGGPALAVAAGVVALWATFVPCFLWIFVSAPYLDRIAGKPRLSAALQAITAAVVGVILNLSLWFALRVLFGELQHLRAGPLRLDLPVLTSLDPGAAAMTALAAALMLGLRRGFGETLAVAALTGAALYLLGAN